jgi:hypothetical protein
MYSFSETLTPEILTFLSLFFLTGQQINENIVTDLHWSTEQVLKNTSSSTVEKFSDGRYKKSRQDQDRNSLTATCG